MKHALEHALEESYKWSWKWGKRRFRKLTNWLRKITDISSVTDRFWYTSTKFRTGCCSRQSIGIWLARIQTMIVIWLVNRLYRQTKRKECGSKESSRLWGGALRDEPKDGYEADYIFPGILNLVNYSQFS